MGIIQCARECKFQKDGYCTLEKCGKIGDLDNDCLYFEPCLFNAGNGLGKTADPDKLEG